MENMYTGIRKCNLFLEKATINTLDEYKTNNDPIEMINTTPN